MNGFFIQQTAPNVFGPPAYREDLLSYSQEDLLADNWYPLVISHGLMCDMNQKQVTTYELRDDGIVYQVHALVNREGEDLNQAIRNKWNQIRSLRIGVLEQTDWTQLADAPITNEKRAEWATYRQALRDITTQSDPFNITWPADPNGRNSDVGVFRVVTN